MRLLSAMCVVFCVFAVIADASAEPVYTYSTSGTSFSAAPGGTLTVQVFLSESLSVDDTSLINSNGGLFSAGFQVAVAPSQTNPGSIKSIAGDSTNFDGGFYTDPADSSTDMRGDNLTGLADTSGPTATAGLVSIGYVTITASSTAGTTTTFQIGAYAPGTGGYTQTFNLPGYDLDVTNNGDNTATYTGAGGTAEDPIDYNNTISLTAVTPEPSCALAFAPAVLLMRRPSRRLCRISS